MSYDLEARAGPAGAAVPPLDFAALHARACALVPALPRAAPRPDGKGLRADGEGFALAPSSRAGATTTGCVSLSAGPLRGAGDEWWMEVTAWLLAGDAGEVIDRHTGRHWPARLLGEWLAVGALFSGRALALNEERIARRGGTAGVTGFIARVDTLTAHAAGGSGGGSGGGNGRGASPELVQRLRDELGYYATRPALVWPVARGLARMGDFSRLEALARGGGVMAATTSSATAGGASGGEPDAFAVAAEYGAAAVPLFQRALVDADPNHRRAAARALHRVRDAAVVPLVARALADKRSTVREAVLEAGFDQVLELAGARAELGPLLARLAAADPSSLVRRQCARLHPGE